ncbi:MAG TPA: MBL fold metallo-hydrolase [Bacilli bacterium]|nr:MBL fold metallo-hydrolase [Bacilli bacterium]HPM07776.1 MBL fold metallo-hydrolase [Bacilli bacterium]
MRFYIIASGSKGNATLLEHDGRVLLIDMGITLARLKSELEAIGYKFKDIEAVLFTHEHSDHASGARFFDDEIIYATEGTLGGNKHHLLKPYEKINILGLDVTPLATSHDAFAPIGFLFENTNEKLVYMTDTGFISEKNLEVMRDADYYIIESNHNIKMLLQTNRPADLKQRILSDFGHLSNEDSALYMSELIGERTKEIVLAHISEEANTNETALSTYLRILKKRFINVNKIRIYCAEQWSMIQGGQAHEN